jgi:transcriptional antiterminator NusG
VVRQAHSAPGDALTQMARNTRQQRRRRREKRQLAAPEEQGVAQRARTRQQQVRPAQQPPKTQTGRRGRGGGSRRFVSESAAELRKVEWPTQRQVLTGTADGRVQMFRWYVINTYSGHENKVKANLEHRIVSMNQQPRFRRVVVPTEQVIETKDGQKVQAEKRVLPGYVLVNMDLDDDAWSVVKNTPGVTGFVGAAGKPIPLSQPEVDRILRTGVATAERARAQVEYSLGESVKVTSGPLSDFDGEIVDVQPDAQKLKVLVDIFERQVPVELGFDQVKKID